MRSWAMVNMGERVCSSLISHAVKINGGQNLCPRQYFPRGEDRHALGCKRAESPSTPCATGCPSPSQHDSRNTSPGLQSHRTQSPRIRSHRTQSPRVQPPRMQSPASTPHEFNLSNRTDAQFPDLPSSGLGIPGPQPFHIVQCVSCKRKAWPLMTGPRNTKSVLLSGPRGPGVQKTLF